MKKSVVLLISLALGMMSMTALTAGDLPQRYFYLENAAFYPDAVVLIIMISRQNVLEEQKILYLYPTNLTYNGNILFEAGKKNFRYRKNSEIGFIIMEEKTDPKQDRYYSNDPIYLQIEKSGTLFNETIRVYTGPAIVTSAEAKTPGTLTRKDPFKINSKYMRKIVLGESNTKYLIKITQFENMTKQLKGKDGMVLYNDRLVTYQSFHFELQTGIYFPLQTGNRYSLRYKNIDDNFSDNEDDIATARKPYIIEEDQPYNTRFALLFSWYPGRFIPESKKFSHRFHLNIGTELSKTIFEVLYFGVGYKAWNWVSFDLLARYGSTSTLDTESGFNVGGQVHNDNVEEIPLVHKDHWEISIALSFPLSIATDIIGKVLGISF